VFYVLSLFVLFFVVLFHLLFFFFFNDTATTEIYTLSLHDALPISFFCTEEIGCTARVGGFLPTGAGAAGAAAAAGACFSARLFLRASIKSITGAICGWATSVTSWPLSLAAIIARTFS